MKKNDLISGKHVVELEDGYKYLFLEGRFVNSRLWYDTDAKICKIFEIQKVYSLSDMLVFGLFSGLFIEFDNKDVSQTYDFSTEYENSVQCLFDAIEVLEK